MIQGRFVPFGMDLHVPFGRVSDVSGEAQLDGMMLSKCPEPYALDPAFNGAMEPSELRHVSIITGSRFF